MTTIEEQLAAKDSEILRLQQELNRRQPAGLTQRGSDRVETRVKRLEGQDLTDDEYCQRYTQVVSEQRDQGFKHASTLYDGGATRLVFERTSRPSVQLFNMNDLVRELERLLTTEEWTAGQRIQLKYLPEGFTDRVEQVLKAIRPKHPSGHLIDASEMALILMRVALHFAPDEDLCWKWRASVRESRETGNGQYECHIQWGVVDQMDDHMTRLGLDPEEQVV